MNVLSLIWRVPASWLYGLVVAIRNELYDMHLLRSYKMSVPTVCVGNLTVGGTGKTPHIEWLVQALTDKYQVAVLSRGYKRKSKGFVLSNAHSTVNDLGDECMQLHRKFPYLPIAVCRDRVEGVRRLKEQLPDLQVVLLDDAFQHRRLICGFNILLTIADNLYTNDHLLPWGRLRDNKQQSHRADVVIVTKCQPQMTDLDRRTLINQLHLPPYQHIFFSQTQYAPLPPNIDILSPQTPVLLITGIAQPNDLLHFLQQRFHHLQHLAFADHHSFSKSDCKQIEQAAQQATVVFTTEKDWSRLESLPLSDTCRQKIFPIPIKAQVREENDVLQLIERYIRSCI